MLVSIFIGMFIVAVLFFILAYFEESVLLSAVSLLFWIVLFASSIGLSVPYVSSGVEYTMTLQEYGVNAVLLGMIFITIVMMISQILDYKKYTMEYEERRKFNL